MSYQKIASLNSISDVNNLEVGQVLRVPYKGQDLSSGGANASLGIGGGVARRPTPNVSSSKTVRLTRAQEHIGKLLWPVPGAKLSSTFGRRWFSFHEGIDLAGAVGTPVYAAHDGRVVYSGNGLRGYGNLVVVQAENGLLTVYAHNDRNLVRVGAFVRKGSRIALLGSTGKSTGPHLHFETRVKDSSGKNVAVDPLVFFP